MAYLHVVVHVLPDVCCAAFFHPDCFEARAAGECVLAYLFERAGKRNFLNLAAEEAPLSDLLYAFRNFGIFQIFAGNAHLPLYSLQSGWEPDTFYYAFVEHFSFVFYSIDCLLGPQPLQTLVQCHALQLLALVKSLCTDFPHARGKDNLLETAALEALHPNRFEPVRKPDVLQTLTLIKGVVPNTLKPFWETD